MSEEIEKKDIKTIVKNELLNLEEKAKKAIAKNNIKIKQFQNKVRNTECNENIKENILKIVTPTQYLLDNVSNVINNKEKIQNRIVNELIKESLDNQNLDIIINDKIKKIIYKDFFEDFKNSRTLSNLSNQCYGCYPPLPPCNPDDLIENPFAFGTCFKILPSSLGFFIPINKEFTTIINNLRCCKEKCVTTCTIPNGEQCEVPVTIGRAVGCIDYQVIGEKLTISPPGIPICCADTLCINQTVCVECNNNPCPQGEIEIINEFIFWGGTILLANKQIVIFIVVFELQCN